MGWRNVVVSKPSKLDYNIGYMVVRSVASTVKVHLSEISMLIVENTACSITCALMSKLTQEKIKVIFCDERRNPSSELTAYYGSHDCSQRLKNQIEWQEDAMCSAWTLIVAEKIKNQMRLLEEFGLPEAQKLGDYIDKIEFYDESNREGQAAKVYFNALFGKRFSRSDDNAVNAALNYGYSLILSCFNRAVVCSGYLTQLGLFHCNMYNQYNLSCDLMEPLRPLVDFRVKTLEPLNTFETAEKRAVVTIFESELKIDGRNNTLDNAIKLYSKSVFNAIEENDMSLIKFPALTFD